jgi:UDPglucose 6-dehydrogenase
MRVVVIGTGYVGLVSGTCLAEMGNEVTCVDVDADKIKRLKVGQIPIYEPGLSELIEANVREERLTFVSDAGPALKDCQIVMIAVGTPPEADGSADLSAVFGVVEQVAAQAPSDCVLVTKSTVPVGTAKKLKERLLELGRGDVPVVSNPEFLKQGDAVNDFLRPDRVVVGTDDDSAYQVMQELYAPFLRTGNRMVFMDVASAEMTKYAANSFLATKISFINEISRLCAKFGADVENVRAGIASDSRIGDKFLFPGLGFGGSCFPKDLQALIHSGREVGCPLRILEAVASVNEEQRRQFFERIDSYYQGQLEGRTLALWGLAFKPRTDDTREAPALALIAWLLERNVKIRAFDPKAEAKTRAVFGEAITYCESSYEALKGSEALIIATEWNEFRRPDFERMKKLLAQPVIFDGRNLYPPQRMRDRGFDYHCIGR